MDYYTLKLFKLTYLNVDLEKSFVTHITDDKSILNIFLKSKMKACKICGCYNIKVRSTTKTKVNHSIYSDLKIELYIHRRKYFFLIVVITLLKKTLLSLLIEISLL